MNLLANLNLNRNELQNAVLQPLSSAPAGTAKLGQIYYNTTDSMAYIYDGEKWMPIGVVYSKTNSTSSVITGMDGSGNVTTTPVGDLMIGEEKLSDIIAAIAADAEQGIADAAAAKSAADDAQDAADAAQADVDALETTVSGLSSAIAGGLKFVAANELPNLETMTDEDFDALTNGTIYLIAKADGESPNLKDEYLFIKGETKANSSFELVGDTKCDLSGYVKSEELENALAGLDVSDSIVSVPAPTEENPNATEDKTIGDVIAEMKEDIEKAQGAADDAQNDATQALSDAADAQSAAEAAQSAAEAAQSAVDALTAANFIKSTKATIAIGQTEVNANFTLTEGQTAIVIGTIAKVGNDVVITDAQISATGVKFSIADAYTSAIDCEVFYFVK